MWRLDDTMKSLFVLTTCLLFIGCRMDKEMALNANVKYSAHGVNLENKIRLDGIFISDDSCDAFVFFPDGGCSELHLKTELPTYHETFIHLEKIKENMKEGLPRYLYKKEKWGWSFGVFEERHDTIKAQFYTDAFVFFVNQWNYVRNVSLVIRDEKRLDLISDEGFRLISNRKSSTFHFVACSNMPTSDAKIKRKKWLWKSEDDWRAYKERTKQKKKEWKQKRKNDAITNRP